MTWMYAGGQAFVGRVQQRCETRVGRRSAIHIWSVVSGVQNLKPERRTEEMEEYGARQGRVVLVVLHGAELVLVSAMVRDRQLSPPTARCTSITHSSG